MILTLVSWNANGLAARMERGDLIPLLRHNPEIVCFQETKIAPSDIRERLRLLHGYQSWFSPLWRDRYCGVGMIARLTPRPVSFAAPAPLIDGKGRVMTADFLPFTLFNVYVPAGDGKQSGMEEKLAFLDSLLDAVGRLCEAGRPVVLCGDFAIAHTDRDLWNPEEGCPSRCGTTREERGRLDRLVEMGFTDTLRLFNARPDAFTWWYTGHGLRQQGRGWRLDYFFVSGDLKDRVRGCSILKGIRGSDHCPVCLELEIAEPAP